MARRRDQGWVEWEGAGTAHCSPAPNICWSHQSFPAATANQHMSNHHKAFHCCCSLVLPLTNSLLLHLDQAELEKSNLLSAKDSS